jgi:hypothetical protein
MVNTSQLVSESIISITHTIGKDALHNVQEKILLTNLIVETSTLETCYNTNTKPYLSDKFRKYTEDCLNYILKADFNPFDKLFDRYGNNKIINFFRKLKVIEDFFAKDINGIDLNIKVNLKKNSGLRYKRFKKMFL